jgi:hypothetical protein
VADAALREPTNDTTEVGGPEAFRMDELVGKILAYDKDARKITVDPDALYYGWVKLQERTLLLGPDARLGPTRLDWWLTHVPAPPKDK